MGKETRIGVGVVGVLVVISAALLYGRLTAHTGLPVELNMDAGTANIGRNEVPRRPTIEQSPSGYYHSARPVSPAPLHKPGAADRGKGPSYLVDPDSSPTPESMRQLTLPEYDYRPRSSYSSPVASPAAQSPAAHSPAAHSPAAHSPAAHSPAAQTPTTQSPAADDSGGPPRVRVSRSN